MSDSNDIPLMFRAQIEGRCQIQRLIPGAPTQQAYDWVQEWITGASQEVPDFNSKTIQTKVESRLDVSSDNINPDFDSKTIQTKAFKITWRFVSNSGQDEGVIRPVTGTKGWPLYPGASMKGAFLRTCTDDQAMKYCGGQLSQKDTKPGILRFHGGYPTDGDWTKKSLVDVVHPQEDWQVKKNGSHSAFIQISLHQPTLVFGISSIVELSKKEWKSIWEIWEKAMERGIGSRVSAGYGQPRKHSNSNLLSIQLKGQGLCSQLIDRTGEFRPNMFKAALRGHTLRLLSGITDENSAEELTKELWGGFAGKNGAIVGLLGIAFNPVELDLDGYSYGRNVMPTYELVDGTLNILCMTAQAENQRKNLKVLISQLIKFSLLFGGFGKSWRRVDHRLFFKEYLTGNYNPMIGCHWQFGEKSNSLYCPVNELSDITNFLKNIQKTLKQWVKLNRKTLSGSISNWREAWHPKKVEVWGRIAKNQLDSKAVRWFHSAYLGEQSIKNSLLTGQMGQIGRIWHRMYPRHITSTSGKLQSTREYVELLTIFPDGSDKTQNFLEFLKNQSDFIKLWPTEE